MASQVRTVLDQISTRLQEDGLPPDASVEEQQRHLWQQLLAREAKLQSATQEVQTLRTQQASEMKEVNIVCLGFTNVDTTVVLLN